MMRVAYIDISTSLVFKILSGGALSAYPLAGSGELAVMTDYAGELPAYWDGQSVLPVPQRPTPAHQWTSASGWVFAPELLSAAQEEAWLRIKKRREAVEFGPFVWSGHTFDGDSESQRRIQGAAQLAAIAQAAGAPWTIVWTLADNSEIEMSAADMIGAGMALATSVASAHATARQLRAQIMQSQTLEELDAVVWPT